MDQANIATLKNNLSRFLKSVQEGREVVVLDRARPIARLVPYREAPTSGRARRDDGDVARIEGLVQRGALTHAGDPASNAAWLKTRRPVKAAKGTPALSDVLLQMREEERW